MRVLLAFFALTVLAAGCCGSEVFISGDHCASDTAVVCADNQGVKFVKRTDCAAQGKKCRTAGCGSKNVAACVAESENVCEVAGSGG
jgi:hypothetical protein